MIFTALPLTGAYCINLDRRADDRGFFARLFCSIEFQEHGLATNFVQVNTSFSRKAGTLRGMHFQRAPMAEAKLVRCLKGRIFDVIVDLRADSETFGHSTTVELDAETRQMIYVPQGFAHGFQTLEPDTELLYFHSQFYSPEHEGGLAHNDPHLSIRWPLAVSELSARDAAFPALDALDPIV
jgi:dTDP-4-dehydrorhamnose 3,5-epimerase